jgi:hypothetical protein
MVMVEGFAVEDEPLQFLDRDKAFEEADKVSKETILASKEARKGGGGGKMGIEKKGGEGLPPPCLLRISLGDIFWRREKRAFVFFRYRKLIFIIDNIKLNIE